MGVTSILSLLSGVALFLYGMSVMGDSLKKVAGNKLELILYKLTSTPLKGILLGTAVTAIIQSSSATTVMVVGFVNSGMMKVAQSIGIIMGANIGTSVTGWILCLSYIEGSGGIAQLLSTATISAVVAIIGIIFRMVMKKDSYRHVGEIMLGFAILMFGMQTMSGAVAPLKDSETFRSMLTMFTNPAAGILVGILFTAVLQSASASVGILQALSVTGGISFAVALPIVMGIGVGAACPVLMSGMSSNKNGKRTALVYLFNDLAGMVICGTLFYAIQAVVTRGGQFAFMDLEMKSVSIALLNTIYRTVTIIILAPFIKQINKLMFWIIKDSPDDVEDQADFDLLEERFLRNPELALTQVGTVMNGMARKAQKNVMRAFDLMENYSVEQYNLIQEKETVIDKYEDKLDTYMMKITAIGLNKNQTRQNSKYLHTVSDFERIADHACGISRAAREIVEKKIKFSGDANRELAILYNAVKEELDMTVKSFTEDNIDMARQVEPLRITVRMLCAELKRNHIVRLQSGNCDAINGFVFNDLLTNLERIVAHCSNIAVAMMEFESDDFNTHQYLKDMRNSEVSDMAKDVNYYSEKYSIEMTAQKAVQDR